VAELIESTEAENSTVKPRRASSGWRGWTTFMLLVIAALSGAGFYLFSELREAQKGLDSEIDRDDMHIMELTRQMTSTHDQIAALQAQLANLETQLSHKDQRFDQSQAETSRLYQEKLDAARKEFSTAVLQIQRQLGKTRGDWLLADAEYLLSIANQRLHIVGDIATTREALMAADQRLRESGDAAVFKVREQLAKELTALSSMQDIDTVGLYASIRQLQEKIDELTVLLPHAGKTLSSPAPKPDKEIALGEKLPDVHDLLDGALVELEGLVTIRRTDQPINAVLTPEQAYFLKEQLDAKLEMAKIALVQHNEALFKIVIDDARQWLSTHFTPDAAQRRFDKELERLARLTLRGELPDISGSLKLLRDLSKWRLETDKALADQANDAVPPIDTTPPLPPTPAQ